MTTAQKILNILTKAKGNGFTAKRISSRYRLNYNTVRRVLGELIATNKVTKSTNRFGATTYLTN